MTGSAKSWDFPWLYNFQPFSGDQDVFVTEIDPTSAGAASLVLSTPLGGTAVAQGNDVAVDAAGNFYVAGTTTAGDFPVAGSTNNGIQLTCASCQQIPPLNDAFLVQSVVSSAPAPSVSFNVAKVNFGTQDWNAGGDLCVDCHWNDCGWGYADDWIDVDCAVGAQKQIPGHAKVGNCGFVATHGLLG